MLLTLVDGIVRLSSTTGEFGVEFESRAVAEFLRLNFCFNAASVASNPTILKLALRLFILVVGEELGLFSFKAGGNNVAAKVFVAAANDVDTLLRRGISSVPWLVEWCCKEEDLVAVLNIGARWCSSSELTVRIRPKLAGGGTAVSKANGLI